MKKYAMLVLATAFMFNVALMAQEQTTPKAKKVETKEVKSPEAQKASIEKRVKNMAKYLNLSDVEKTKVQELFENQNLKGKAKDAELKKIIGDEKFEKYQKIQAEKKANKKVK